MQLTDRLQVFANQRPFFEGVWEEPGKRRRLRVHERPGAPLGRGGARPGDGPLRAQGAE